MCCLILIDRIIRWVLAVVAVACYVTGYAVAGHITAGILSVLVAGDLLARWYARRFTRIGIAHIDWGIRMLMESGAHKTRLHLKDPESRRALYFVKLMPFLLFARFVMYLDARDCPSEEFAAAQKALAEAGIWFRIGTEAKAGLRNLLVECGQDAEKSIRAATAVLVKGFGLAADGKVDARILGPYNPFKKSTFNWSSRPYYFGELLGRGEDFEKSVEDRPFRSLRVAPRALSAHRIDDCIFDAPEAWLEAEVDEKPNEERILHLQKEDGSVTVHFVSRARWFRSESPHSEAGAFFACQVDIEKARSEYESDRGFFDAALRMTPKDVDLTWEEHGKPLSEAKRTRAAMVGLRILSGVEERLKTDHAEGFCRLKTNKKKNRFEGTAILFTPEGELIGKIKVDASPISDEVQRCFETIIASFRKVKGETDSQQQSE